MNVLADFISQICTKWYLIANIIGGRTAVAANGDIDCLTGDAKAKMSKVFKTWIDSGENVRWSRLVEALKSLGMRAWSDQLEEKLEVMLSQLRDNGKGIE